MTEAQSPQPADASELLARAQSLFQHNEWEDLAALGNDLPMPLDGKWLEVADAVAFAFGKLRQWKVAIGLLQHAFEIEPTWRRASSLAYVYYDASLALVAPRGPKPDEDKETLRNGFRRWIGEALRFRPDSIKDLYRLGVFEAQVESRHDRPALRAFLRAIELFREMPAAERERRGDLRKTCTKALYAAARSAMRLRETRLARKLIFACIREDEGVDHVDPVHKLHLASRVCLANRELDHAERAARLALDAKGPPHRDYLFGLLSDIALENGDPRSACTWIEDHVPEHRRQAPLWRKLGDARRNAGDRDGACRAWESALMRDRCGRHLTLVRLGRAHLEAGALGKAEDAFRKAAQFRASRYMREDEEALKGLLQVLEARGKVEEVPRIQARLAKCGPPVQEELGEEAVA